MSKGLKMEAAKKKDSGDFIFNIGQLNKSNNGNLKCKFCNAEVQYASAYTKKSSQTPVAAYLKLWQKENHKEGCAYSVKGAIDLLVANSKAIEDILPIFELQHDGSYLFRMNILVEAQRVAQKLSDDNSVIMSSGRQFDGRNYVPTERHIASYFRSASGIAKLRALIQESLDIKQLTDLIKIKHKDDYINWDDFYYDESRYHVLYNRLEKGKLTHPVAINVKIDGEVNHNATAKRFPWSFKCFRETVQTNNKKLVIIPKLQLAKEQFVSPIISGESYLVVGEIWASAVKDVNSIFRNINISVYNKFQFQREIDVQ